MTVWFDIWTCSSSEFKTGSLYSSHHLPRSLSSPGCATFQPGPSLNCCGADSLNACGAFTGGFAYLGAGLHEQRTMIAAAAASASHEDTPCLYLIFLNIITHLSNPMP